MNFCSDGGDMGVIGPHGIDHIGLRHRRVEGVESNLSLIACVLIGLFMLSKIFG